jgi:hypothetical protein
MKQHIDIDSGRYYTIDEKDCVETAPQVPDMMACRRVVDFPGGREPDGAALDTCRQCSALIAYDPHGPHLDVTRVCFQCCGFEPAPIENAKKAAPSD